MRALVAEVRSKHPEHVSFVLAVTALLEVSRVTLGAIKNPPASGEAREALLSQATTAMAQTMTLLSVAYAKAARLDPTFAKYVAEFSVRAGETLSAEARATIN